MSDQSFREAERCGALCCWSTVGKWLGRTKAVLFWSTLGYALFLAGYGSLQSLHYQMDTFLDDLKEMDPEGKSSLEIYRQLVEWMILPFSVTVVVGALMLERCFVLKLLMHSTLRSW